MLVIRDEQLAALTGERRQRVVIAEAERLRARFHDLLNQSSADAVRALVAAGIVAAAAHGLEREGDVRRYLDYVVCLGPTFDAVPDVAAILAQRTLSARARLDLLDDWFVFSNRSA